MIVSGSTNCNTACIVSSNKPLVLKHNSYTNTYRHVQKLLQMVQESTDNLMQQHPCFGVVCTIFLLKLHPNKLLQSKVFRVPKEINTGSQIYRSPGYYLNNNYTPEIETQIMQQSGHCEWYHTLDGIYHFGNFVPMRNNVNNCTWLSWWNRRM